MLKSSNLNTDCSEGCGIEFFTYICCKNRNDVCLKRPKINDKRGRGWPIKKLLLGTFLLEKLALFSNLTGSSIRTNLFPFLNFVEI